MKKILKLCLMIAMIFAISVPVNASTVNASAVNTNNSQINEEELVNQEKKLEQREKNVDRREKEVFKQKKDLDKREEELNVREEDLDKREEEIKAKEESLQNVQSSKLIEGVNLTRIGTVTEENVQAVVNGFNSLPIKVQEKIIAGGYKFEVTSEDIELLITGTGTNSWYGATAGTPLFITLIGNNQSNAEMTRTTIHECGHALDNTLGIVSSSADFQSIYASEGKTMYKTADVHDASEWFSECLVYYIQSPAILKQTAPNSYNYMDNLLTNILK